MDKGIKSLKKLIAKEGPPVVRMKDPFAHWHPRRQRTLLQKEFKDVPIEQIKEMAQSELIYRSSQVESLP